MLRFIGIGAQKSGTSWLYEVLSKHPSVSFPAGKEVHFWDAHYLNGVGWYSSLFSEERCNGDITPAYAILPLDRIREVHQYFPSLRIVYLMRNPIERAWSSARMALRRAEMEFCEASDQWFIDHFKSQGSLQRGDYANCLRNWMSVYPRESFLISRYETIAHDPVGFANRVLSHIGLGEFFSETHRPELSRPVFEGYKSAIRPELLQVLHRLYADKIDALSELLEADFSDWKNRCWR
ncbi:hypothetical protein A7317_19895 [Pseudomonas fluorescens]|jgi:hypothetical protein|uniref:Sulfotransferase n=1 Tax=Pseudomonas fluorescens TaxID=294 RepID=A0A1B3DCB9_PSEFL|nr:MULTISPECIES: sulfotransferase [Pseudomonas]AOE69165.1 hypothetical protein A7317_19895 [Pseudomonas fluorescens]AOE74950.1 hypothetical protein A7319_19710 [Pseudomonas fluorescens]PMX27542.1 sulfotransferase [Pseudomonas sp. GW460-12]PMX37160.1 sulfotransferase [Pseudomonas sp. MPR-R2A4]PMX43131.1 sulfotransferase [Pseudomonas sp. MPR-R2A7]